MSAPPPVRDGHLGLGTACLKCALEPTALSRWGSQGEFKTRGHSSVWGVLRSHAPLTR